ncbi:MAG: DNA polymerase III subunit delta [Patescibacteria group bacterium]
MILSLIGVNSFQRTQRLRVLRRGFVQKYDHAGFNIQEFVGKEMTEDDFRRTASTGGLFATKRLVIWHDPFAALQEVRDGVARLMSMLTEDAVVILVLDALPKKKDDLVDLIKKNKQELFPSLSVQESIAWITQVAGQAGVQIETAAAKYLAEVAGGDLWLAYNEIQKLASRLRHIQLADLKQDFPDPTTDTVFAFTDALTARHAARTLQLMHQQLADGLSPFQLLAMVSRQLSILAQLKETGGEGTQLHPFVIKKNLSLAKQLSAQTLFDARQRLLEDEVKIKTGQVDAVTALDLFVIDWCR